MAPERRSGWINFGWVIFFGVASSVATVAGAARLSATFDEPTYLNRGLDVWRSGSHKPLMRLGTMPLPVDLQALPLYLAERWRGQPWDTDADFDRLLPWMRAGNLVFWWLLLIYGFRIGRDLAGNWGGRLAVAALACEPNLFAHAGLATTDIAITACLLAFAFHFRRGREAGRAQRILIPGLWFGVALLAKASALAFGPICMVMIELERRLQGRRNGAAPAPYPFVKDAWRIGWIGLFIAFVYVGSDFTSEPTFVTWAQKLDDGPGKVAMLWVAEHLRIFTNAGEGIVQQIKHNLRGHDGHYILGHSGPKAVWYYFPAALAVKLTAPLLVAAALVVLRPRLAAGNWAVLAAAAMLIFSLNCRVQIGVRLQFPLVALATIGLTAAMVRWQATVGSVAGKTILTAATVGGLTWMTAGTAMIWPHGLCFVNELWGGPDEGYRLVSDANYDWGQGLKDLADWQRESDIEPLDVWYFGADPAVKRMPVRKVEFHNLRITGPDDVRQFCAGRMLAVSTTLVYGYALSESHRKARDYLRTLEPVARTTTFLIYDFTDEEPVRCALVARGSGS